MTNKKKPQTSDQLASKQFEKLSHRIYFVNDLLPHDAFILYAYISKQPLKEAAKSLVYLNQQELDWAEQYMKSFSGFNYKVSFYSKKKYIKFLKIKYEV